MPSARSSITDDELVRGLRDIGCTQISTQGTRRVFFTAHGHRFILPTQSEHALAVAQTLFCYAQGEERFDAFVESLPPDHN